MTMSNTIVLQKIKESRRDALITYFVSKKIPPSLQEQITDIDSLYEYLLLDTRVSDSVKTTPVAEAISSLQMFIHRCMEGDEEALNETSKSLFTKDQFLYNWDAYNKRYSVWAGKERLKYYAGSYIDPQLRLGKTEIFSRFGFDISQGRVAEESVFSALQTYLTEYEKLAGLTYINSNIGEDESTLYFIGQTETMPYEYYWRSLKLIEQQGKLVPHIWSEWKKITANIVDAKNDDVYLYWESNRLYVQWVSVEREQEGIDGFKDQEYTNVWQLNSSNVWQAYSKERHTLNSTRAYGSIVNGYFNPPAGSQISGTIKLGLSKNIDFSQLLDIDYSNLFAYDVQLELGGLEAFSGSMGIYIWEIFFHIPFLVAVRFLTEQRYEYAEKWLNFLFDSSGYRDEDGNIQMTTSGSERYWNIVPLQEETEWDDTLSIATTDPDRIALADPMHYKLAVFLRTLDYLISHGDHLYRQVDLETLNSELKREAMKEAKLLYVQASKLLGDRPEIPINNNWSNPTLCNASEAMTIQPTVGQWDDNVSVSPEFAVLGQILQAQSGYFLPPYNYELLTFWEKIDIRLYNLRHNLSLDGQPLHLPIFAEPVDPRELQKKMMKGDGLGARTIVENADYGGGYRFPMLVEKARAAVHSLSQFGNSLLSALQNQDYEAMQLLMQTQRQAILNLSREIEDSNVAVIEANLEALEEAYASAKSSKKHFVGLLENWISTDEREALSLHSRSAISRDTSNTFMMAGSVLDLVPNIWGLAVGGVNLSSVPYATAHGFQKNADNLLNTANIMEITESYRRRMEDWTFQRNIYDNEAKRLSAEIESLKNQLVMANKQIALADMEYAHAQAIYELQSTRFTSQALYNWLTGQLASLYNQLYDASLPLCLMAKEALIQELGSEHTENLFTVPTWNDLYQGLLTGEMLLVELQRLENVWIEENNRGLEVVKTVSLDDIIQSGFTEESFVDLVKDAINGEPRIINGVGIQMENNILYATLDLEYLGLNNSYNQKDKKRRIKNISVTLPTLLRPYQDIEASLIFNDEMAALSHGIEDSGLFYTDFNDSRFLPFEGMDPTTGILQLGIYNAGSVQYDIVENLNDVIFRIRYNIK